LLLGQLGRERGVTQERAVELSKVQGEMQPILEGAASAEQATRLKSAASRALEIWAQK